MNKVKKYFKNLNYAYVFIHSFIAIILLCCLIFLIKFINSLWTKPTEKIFVIVSYILLLILLFLFLFNFIRKLFIKNQNRIDDAIVSYGFCFLFIGLVFLPCFKLIETFKSYITSIICFALFLLSDGFAVFRIIFLNIKANYNEPYTLSSLYFDKPRTGNNFNIIDTFSPLDIFERKNQIKTLRNHIDNYNYTNPLVIGINGKWGIGKTSLICQTLENYRTNNDYIIIDDFDIWQYDSELKLFEDIYRKIIEKVDIKLPDNKIEDAIYTIASRILTVDSKTISLYLHETYSEKTINDTINYKLSKNNKKILFVIDNLDRSLNKNILFLFKALSSIIGINNVIYILGYDKENLESVFDNIKIDKSFVEKIINFEIDVPPLNSFEHAKIICDCIEKQIAFIRKQKQYTKKINIDYLKECLSYNLPFDNIRQFVLLLNDMPKLLLYYEENPLDFEELVTVDILRICNMRILNHIKLNPRIYKTVKDNDYFHTTDSYKLDVECLKKQYNFGGEWKQYSNLVGLLYPNILDLINCETTSRDEERLSVVHFRDSNGTNMYVYFCDTEELDYYKQVDATLKLINEQRFEKMIIYYSSNNDFKDTLRTISMNDDEIDNESGKRFIEFIINNYISIKEKDNALNETFAWDLGKLIAKIIYQNGCDLNLIDLQNEKYFIYPIIIALDELEKIVQNKDYSNYDKIKNICQQMKNKIFSTFQKLGLNLFDEKFYSRNLIMKIETENGGKQYIQSLLNDDNIYKFLVSKFHFNPNINGSYVYWFDEKDFENYDKKNINNLINNHQISNSDEDFVFNTYKNGGEKVIDGLKILHVI